MDIINGYIIKEKIYESDNSIIYRAIRDLDNTPIIIKMLPSEYSTIKEIQRFQLEYEIANSFNHEGIIKIFSIEKYNRIKILTMEDFKGISINNILLKRKISLEEFLIIAMKTTDALDEIHRKHIIHKDINPSNLIWNAESKSLKIIDFGISTRLPYEVQALIDPNSIEGSIAYMPPEQTGRINKNIDYRSDYYSLGITLYEIITGDKPFESDDILEMLYFHIAKTPASPYEKNLNIPKSISNIIMKLIEKNAEDRYQSSFGISYDLKMCLESYKEFGCIRDFEICKKDISEQFKISQKLFGRENELRTLLVGFDQVCQNSCSQMLMVVGSSGIGKSILIHEVYKPILEKRGYFISGKFDQISRNDPYLPIIQAIQSLITQILEQTEEQLNIWRNRILGAVGNIGQVIINVIPELESIIGKQPEIPELDPSREQNRFSMAFASFIKVLATKQNPLVIFIDDLQWADIPSLKMIELLMSDIDIKNIYFIGAYRENEVDKSHPLTTTLIQIYEIAQNINTIRLKELNIEDISRLIIDTFKWDVNKTEQLSTVCMEKTSGNPFFLNQFLKTLYKDELIKFNNNSGEWICDIVKIKEAEVTGNVVDFVLSNIKKMSPRTQQLLSLAACIGNQFDLSTISIIYEKNEKETSEALWEALQGELISPVDSNYMLNILTDENIDGSKIKYRFYHDKIQQASYLLIKDDLKAKLHLKIGRLILKSIPDDLLTDKIFEIANHINKGFTLITDAFEKKKFAELYLIASIKATHSTAYDLANTYINNSLSLTNNKMWSDDYSLMHKIYTHATENAYLCGNYIEMENYSEVVIANSRTLSDKIYVYLIKIRSLISQNKITEALSLGIYVLKLLGVKLKEHPLKLDVILAFIKIKIMLFNVKEDQIINNRYISEQKVIDILTVINTMSNTAYLTNQPLLFLLSVELIKITLKYGNHSQSIMGFGILTLVNFAMEHIEDGNKWFEVYQKLYEKYSSPEVKSFYKFAYGVFFSHHTTLIKDTLKYFDEAHTFGIEVGDFEYAGFSLTYKIRTSFIIGENLKLIYDNYNTSLAKLKKLKQNTLILIHKLNNQVIHNLIFEVERPDIFSGEYFNEGIDLKEMLESKNDTFIFSLYYYKMFIDFLFNKNSDAYHYAKIAEKYMYSSASSIMQPMFFGFYILVLTSIYKNASKSEKIRLRMKIKHFYKKLEYRSKFAPMNYQHKLFLAQAEIARVNGDALKAMEFYDKSIDLALKNEYIHDEALENELAGKFYLSLGREKVAFTYLNNALRCYSLWGASSKVRHLYNLYPKLQDYGSNIAHIKSKTAMTSTSTLYQNLEVLDINSILKASQAISEEIEFKKLIEKLIKVLIENAGAQKIILLTKQNGAFIIQVEYDVSSDNASIIEYTDFKDKLPSSLINLLIRTKDTIVLSDAKESQFVNDEYIKEKQPKSIICMPLIYRGNLNNILYLENNLITGAFTKERVKVLNMLSSQIVTSLENATLYQQAIIDGLTQIYNRSFFDNYLMICINKSQRYNLSLCLLMIDIDHFKKFNDTYGHQVGDLVLKTVAKCIENVIRKADIVARYGGEEFVVVLPEIRTHGAAVVAEKIRRSIEEYESPYITNVNNERLLLNITISIGISEFEKGEDRMSFIKRADQNLYKAKESGRNCVVS